MSGAYFQPLIQPFLSFYDKLRYGARLLPLLKVGKSPNPTLSEPTDNKIKKKEIDENFYFPPPQRKTTKNKTKTEKKGGTTMLFLFSFLALSHTLTLSLFLGVPFIQRQTWVLKPKGQGVLTDRCLRVVFAYVSHSNLPPFPESRRSHLLEASTVSSHPAEVTVPLTYLLRMGTVSGPRPPMLPPAPTPRGPRLVEGASRDLRRSRTGTPRHQLPGPEGSQLGWSRVSYALRTSAGTE